MNELKYFRVTSHTRNVSKDSTFVAIKGMQFNGIDYISEALQKGASTIVLEKNNNLNEYIKKAIATFKPAIIEVDDCRKALSQLSAKAYNYPAKKLNIIGLTGTKGKTTSAFLLYHLFKTAGYKTALITGVKNYINDIEYKSELTTPHPDYLHAFFNECVNKQVKFVIMEASAQGFSLKRLNDIQFSAGIFTNFDLEHSEFYNSMDEYFAAKCEIFDHLKVNAPFIVNVDNEWGKKVMYTFDSLCSLSMTGISHGVVHLDRVSVTNEWRGQSNYNFTITKNDASGLEFTINNNKFYCPNLVGTFNAYNIAGVVLLALQMDMDIEVIQKALETFDHVPGRMERYKLKNGAVAVIDYAHNPSSFEQLLPTLRAMTNNLIVVFGCGGGRDNTKRPIMGNIASTIADQVVITSDNPRFEKVEDILDEIYSGIRTENQYKVKVMVDRSKAIEYAYRISSSNSIIAILGKGPDEYEMLGNEKLYFSDKEVILNCDK